CVLAGIIFLVVLLVLHPNLFSVVELHFQLALVCDRLVVLGGLEVLRHVRVEVVLPGEPAGLGDLAVQRQSDPDRVLHRTGVDHRQRTRQTEGDRGDRGVRLLAEARRGVVEHLRGGAQLHVHLDAEHRVEPGDGVVVVDQRGHAFTSISGARASSGPPFAWSSRASSAAPTRYSRSSARAGARIWKPTGRPSSLSPFGSDRPGTPARFAGMVATSLRYMANGSSTFSPKANAVVGAVGETSTSACSNAAAKSRWISVRTFC